MLNRNPNLKAGGQSYCLKDMLAQQPNQLTMAQFRGCGVLQVNRNADSGLGSPRGKTFIPGVGWEGRGGEIKLVLGRAQGCYGLNGASPRIHVLKPQPQCDGVGGGALEGDGGWGPQEGG